jgi:hypothetical protein
MTAISSNYIPNFIRRDKINTITKQSKADINTRIIWRNFVRGLLCGTVTAVLYLALKISSIIKSGGAVIGVKIWSAVTLEGIFLIIATSIIADITIKIFYK